MGPGCQPTPPVSEMKTGEAHATVQRRWNSPTATLPATAVVPTRPPRTPESKDLLGLAYCRRPRQWRRPWRCGGSARRRGVDGDRNSAIAGYIELPEPNVTLTHPLEGPVVVGDGPATVSANSGEAQPWRRWLEWSQRPYLSSNGSAKWWRT